MAYYIAFVESEILSTPHMEPLASETQAEACEEARRLLAQHSSGIAVHVFEGDANVFTYRPERRAG